MSDWKTVKLGDVASFLKGKGLSKDEIVPNGRYECIHYGELFTKYGENIHKITSRTNLEGSLVRSEANDVLMPTSDVTPRGLSTASFLDKPGVILGGDILIIRPNPDHLNGLFLAHFIAMNKNKVIRLVSGSTIFHIYGSDMAKLSLYIPPLSEQIKMVNLIEVWDRYLENLNKKIEHKKNIKTGIMHQILSGNTDCEEKHLSWETVELSQVAVFVNGYTFKSNDYVANGKFKIITIANVQDGKMATDKVSTIDQLPSNIAPKQVLKFGDILISMTGNVGRVCRVDEENCLLNQRVGKIIPIKIDGNLLYYLLHSRKFLNSMIVKAQGGAQDNLSAKDIKGYRLFIPSKFEEQQTIAGMLMAADKEIQFLEIKRKIFQNQKRYLLKGLLSGRLMMDGTMKLRAEETQNA